MAAAGLDAWTRAHFPPGRKRNEGGQRARPGTNSCIERQLARLKDEELRRKTAALAFSDSSDLFFFKRAKASGADGARSFTSLCRRRVTS